ncbi:MAG TPA: metalloregulator ArsR/SmtB family transcription factor [Gemmatimonadaceae bacterium]
MAKTVMSEELTALVAERFKALADRARVRLLSALRDGERSVGELVDETGLTQANVSKHLARLHQLGFVTRHRDGLHIYYELADPDVLRLCDLMCGRIEAEARTRRALFPR